MEIVKTIDENTLSFELEGKKDSLDKIESICQKIGDIWQLPVKHIFTINLIIEELVSNTIFYGFAEEKEKYINANLSKQEDVILLKIKDNAIAFNPIAINSEPKNVKLEEMEIGGLGIHLVKSMSEKVEYQNINGENIMTIEISIRN